MDRQIEGPATAALNKATSFLSKRLYWKDRAVIVLIGLFAILIGFFMLQVEKQTGALRFWGYMSFFVMVIFLVYAIPVFTRTLYKWEWVESKYEKTFKSYPPLLIALTTFTPDSPLGIQRLLINRSPIALRAYRNERILINEQEHIVISLGLELTHSVFLRWRAFLQHTNECLRGIYEHMPAGINAIWTTGEFGMLRDQEFLNSIEEWPEGNCVTIIGYVEGRPSKLNKVLELLSKVSENDISEGEVPKDRQIGPQRQKQIRRLVKNRKLFLRVSPTRLEEPHMAVVGEYIWIQQQHKHSDEFKAVSLIKNSSESLKRFANDYLKERMKASTACNL